MGQSTKTVSTHYLESTDSGVHTCIVYGINGETGNASVTVNVVGKLILIKCTFIAFSRICQLHDDFAPLCSHGIVNV